MSTSCEVYVTTRGRGNIFVLHTAPYSFWRIPPPVLFWGIKVEVAYGGSFGSFQWCVEECMEPYLHMLKPGDLSYFVSWRKEGKWAKMTWAAMFSVFYKFLEYILSCCNFIDSWFSRGVTALFTAKTSWRVSRRTVSYLKRFCSSLSVNVLSYLTTLMIKHRK